MRHPLAMTILVAGISVLPVIARAQWQVDGVAISTAASSQVDPMIVSDGAGGAIVTWYDQRSGTSWDVYAQRVSVWGVPQWTADGVALCTLAGDQVFPTIASDGAGGAIVAWHDYRGGAGPDIYAQRVNASGAPQWTANGVALCIEANEQWFPTMVADGAGGAIVTWPDLRSGTFLDIYAQRVNASGSPQWTANGVALCIAANEQNNPRIVSDGAAGAIITWSDFRSLTSYDIYSQRVNAAGVPQWTADGVALCTAAFGQGNPTIVADGAGGAIVTWRDFRSAAIADIYAQRINAAGAPQWMVDGVAVCTAASGQFLPTIVSDGAGGAIVAWHDYRGGANTDIYTQRVNNLGVPQWTANGVVLCNALNDQLEPRIVSDGSGGAIATWHDERTGTDIYTQRVNNLGVPQWTANGLALCTAANVQDFPTIVSDGAGGAVVTWYDYRNGPTDIYAQRVNGSGAIPTAVAGPTRGPALIVNGVYPNPFTGTASMDIELTTRSTVRVEIFDVAGRRVRSMTLSEAVSQRVEFDGRDDANRLLPSGVYFYRVMAAGETLTRKMVIAR